MSSDQLPLENENNDESDSSLLPASSRSNINAQGSQGFVNQPQGPVYQTFHNYYQDPTNPNPKRELLEKMRADHSSLVSNWLESFVGRGKELAEIRQQIAEKLPTGGYVIISGRAGQGKSSMIARLVKEYDHDASPDLNPGETMKFDSLSSKIAHHFISVNPGPDHQIDLLLNLMARLILKHGLSDSYVRSESQGSLRAPFSRLLSDLAAKGEGEVIFVDGLDQLEEEANGRRDLSFLPSKLPEGIVVVLGTRPDDTLKSLESLKSRYEYSLPDFSPADFDLLLKQRHLALNSGLVNRFYQAMQKNALYLDLLAKELTEMGALGPEQIIKRVENNPDNLFSLALERFKLQEQKWERVIRPLLGVLLTAQQPLSIFHLHQILGLTNEQAREGLHRLGGLVAEDGEGRHYLFHPKLRDYLRQDEHNPTKQGVFASDEEKEYHQKIADWCAREELELIWEDTENNLNEQNRRLYARLHYITHLYRAGNYRELWTVLDEGQYGQAKLRYDPTTRLYVQDLNLGRASVIASEGNFSQKIEQLPRLWRYSLLHGSLAIQVDSYPNEVFEVMALLGRGQKALELVARLNNLERKVHLIIQIVRLAKENPDHEQLLTLTVHLLTAIEPIRVKALALRQLSQEFARMKHWDEALRLAYSIELPDETALALHGIIFYLAQAEKWERAIAVAETIKETPLEKEPAKTETWQIIANRLIKAKKWAEAEKAASFIEDPAKKEQTLNHLAQVRSENSSVDNDADKANPDDKTLETKIVSTEDSYDKAQTQAKRALKAAEAGSEADAKIFLAETIKLVQARKDRGRQATALSRLAVGFAQAKQPERAAELLNQAQALALEALPGWQRGRALSEVAVYMTQIGIRHEESRIQFNRAYEQLKNISGQYAKGRLLKSLIQNAIAAQDWDRADRFTRQLKVLPVRLKAFIQLAVAQARAGRLTSANKILAKVLKALPTKLTEPEKYELLSEVIDGLMIIQDWDRAEEVIRSLEIPTQQALLLSRIARKLAEAGQNGLAKEKLTESEILTKTIQDPAAKIQALSEVALTRLALKEPVLSQEQLGLAEELLPAITDSSNRAIALSAVATSWAATHQIDRALELARQIPRQNKKTRAAHTVAMQAANLGQWDKALKAVYLIEDDSDRAETMLALMEELIRKPDPKRALWLVQQGWLSVNSRASIIQLLPLVNGLISSNPKIDLPLLEAFAWVDEFLENASL